jgi:uridine phosphorylase
MDWLKRLEDMGVTNIEMEAPEFAAFCKRMKVPALLICVTLLNRMEGDQV